MIYHFIKAITDRSKSYVFLSIGILAAYIPYIGISRIMFIYHYFPVVPLMILAIVGTIKDIEENLQQTNWWKWYAVIAVVVFLFFYPIYSGFLIPAWYARLTEWFPAWQLSNVRYMQHKSSFCNKLVISLVNEQTEEGRNEREKDYDTY